MRVLFVDIDSLRPDHLGCYGYERPTSPNIDAVAAEGLRFENCFTSDAPCLPSRVALTTGLFGMHSGVVSLTGARADPFPIGSSREMGISDDMRSLFSSLRELGFYVTSISSFPERHAAWSFCAGLNEWLNPGLRGYELASDVNTLAIRWLRANARRDNWFLHVNYWDPHTPYRAPAAFGHPFADYAPPNWYSEEVRLAHYAEAGAMTASDLMSWWEDEPRAWPRMPDSIRSIEDWRGRIDGYDTGVRYADHHLGQLIDVLATENVLDETAIVISADHGESLGELNVYSDHHCADVMTCRVPLVMRWPGVTRPGTHSAAFVYQLDLAATLVELLGGVQPSSWDASSFAAGVDGGKIVGHPYLVFGQMSWNCQRGVRWGDWLLIRSYHPGWRNLPLTMLFDLARDPHELNDCAAEEGDRVQEGLALLEEWHSTGAKRSSTGVDPLQEVLSEGGPGMLRANLTRYTRALRARGEHDAAASIEASWRSAQAPEGSALAGLENRS